MRKLALPHWRERRFGHVNVSAGVQARNLQLVSAHQGRAGAAFADVVASETLSDHHVHQHPVPPEATPDDRAVAAAQPGARGSAPNARWRW